MLESNHYVKLSSQGAVGQANEALIPTSLHPKRVTLVTESKIGDHTISAVASPAVVA